MNSREYIGVELNQPLVVDQEYYLSFYVSRAHQFNAFNLASNNIGALFMMENTLNSEELGPTPNFSSFNDMNLVEDTINWVEMSYQFIADSAYQFVAFGNFFDDILTDTLRIGGEPDGNVTSYYYFDDFCLTTSPDGCDFTNSTSDRREFEIVLYPNPCQNKLFIEHTTPIDEILIYTVQGELLSKTLGNGNKALKLDLDLQSGVYLIVIHSKGQKVTRRFVVTN